MLHHCLEHSTGFQFKARIQYKNCLLVLFSVSLTTPCHLTFLTFFIHTNHLERCALFDTFSAFSSLASVWRTFGRRSFSVFGPHCPGIPYLYLSEKLSVFSTFKKKLKNSSVRKSISADICKRVLLCMSLSWLCVCV